ncbi:MAG TPA: NADPH:quinone reductase [Nocardioidaceae bacterium]|nr:NADPH:quinone reductase [Nocardioidaceae bacterium]
MPTPMMTAAYVEALGPAAEIRVGPLPVPAIGPTDVLVAVDTVALNPVDVYVRSGRYRTPVPLPFIVGRDLVGVVAAVGSAASPFRPGEPVWSNSLGHDGRQGSFAEYAAVPADRLYHLPDGASPHTAVAVAHPAATAYLGLFVHARLRAGETVFVGGGAGNVGTAAIQMAVVAGARVITSAGVEDHASCRDAGAAVVLDYRDPHLRRRLLSYAGAGVDIWWDTSGTNDLALAAEATAVGGRILLTAARSAHSTAPLPQLYTRDLSVHGFVISRASVSDLAAAAAFINTLLPAGLLRTRITDELPLADTAAAHERMEAGAMSGRLLLRP